MLRSMTDPTSSGDPMIKLAGLSIWAKGRERPDTDDGWDGNWITIQASVQASGAYVEVSGAILRSDEVASFVRQLETLYAELRGSAELDCAEPQLRRSSATLPARFR